MSDTKMQYGGRVGWINVLRQDSWHGYQFALSFVVTNWSMYSGHWRLPLSQGYTIPFPGN